MLSPSGSVWKPLEEDLSVWKPLDSDNLSLPDFCVVG